ncbi:unnamed protein product [Callosobruchus maculatus]|uniref:Uncharacterized protein n=1 Tax=Callosobruchus maculatus TaxID=64391 RepID=A0A653DR35_CALMS|nr:unnamed protein product [Callosobruchus maculatus]
MLTNVYYSGNLDRFGSLDIAKKPNHKTNIDRDAIANILSILRIPPTAFWKITLHNATVHNM